WNPLSIRGGAARNESADRADEAVEDEAGEADVGKRDDDVGETRGVPGVPDEESDADAAGQHFRRHDRKPSEPDADPQPGEDVGRGGRDHDLGEELERVETEHFCNVTVILRNIADPDSGVDDDRPDACD